MIPYTVERRPDTNVTNVAMGVWLFLASEVMLFGALFSCYALLRIAAPTWPSGRDVLHATLGAINTVILFGLTTIVWRARGAAPPAATTRLFAATALALVFLVVKGLEYRSELAAGLIPSRDTFLAMYFVLTGLHALHVIGGACGNLWAALAARRVAPALTAGRVHALALYWAFVDLVWLVIFGAMYLA